MARYATGEERYECPKCLILCTKREMKIHEQYTWILSCPNCGLELITVSTVSGGEVVSVIHIPIPND